MVEDTGVDPVTQGSQGAAFAPANPPILLNRNLTA